MAGITVQVRTSCGQSHYKCFEVLDGPIRRKNFAN